MNSTLGSVVPLAMFVFVFALLRSSNFSVPDVFVKYFYLYFHFSEVTTFQAFSDVFVKYLYLKFKPFHTGMYLSKKVFANNIWLIEVFAITFSQYLKYLANCTSHTAPQQCQPEQLDTLSFMFDLF